MQRLTELARRTGEGPRTDAHDPRGRCYPRSVVSKRSAKILVIGGNTPQRSKLDIQKEVNRIKRELREGGRYAELDVRQQTGQPLQELTTSLMREEPQILHFSGHASDEGLSFPNTGGSTLVDPKHLGDLLETLGGPRCFVLNACETSELASRIAEHVDVVVGLQGPVTDEESIEFVGQFYRALGFGKSLGDAFLIAEKQCRNQGVNVESSLFVRPGADATAIRLLGEETTETTEPSEEEGQIYKRIFYLLLIAASLFITLRAWFS